MKSKKIMNEWIDSGTKCCQCCCFLSFSQVNVKYAQAGSYASWPFPFVVVIAVGAIVAVSLSKQQQQRHTIYKLKVTISATSGVLFPYLFAEKTQLQKIGKKTTNTNYFNFTLKPFIHFLTWLIFEKSFVLFLLKLFFFSLQR